MTSRAPRLGIVAGLIALGAMACTLPPAFAASSASTPPASASAPGLARPRTITTVHRCIDARGQTQYSQAPCPASSAASALRLGDAPTAAQAKQGHEIQARMRKLDRRMQHDRLQLAREGARRKAASLTVAARDASARKSKDKAKAPGRAADKTASRPSVRKPEFTARVPRQQDGSPRQAGVAP